MHHKCSATGTFFNRGVLVTITEGVRSQIYFGGILIDHSFDLISLSFLRFCLSLRFVILQWTYLMMQMITWYSTSSLWEKTHNL